MFGLRTTRVGEEEKVYTTEGGTRRSRNTEQDSKQQENNEMVTNEQYTTGSGNNQPHHPLHKSAAIIKRRWHFMCQTQPQQLGRNAASESSEHGSIKSLNSVAPHIKDAEELQKARQGQDKGQTSKEV